jgi:hypothetical protein
MPYVEREPVVTEPDSGSATGFAAIKYTAIVIIVLALIAFMVWAIGQFT